MITRRTDAVDDDDRVDPIERPDRPLLCGQLRALRTDYPPSPPFVPSSC
jgi:hypothetical protein